VDTSRDVGYLSTNATSGTSLHMALRDQPMPPLPAFQVSGDLKMSSTGSLTQPARLRRDFRKSAYWQESVMTDASGKATARFKLPDTLTTWRAEVFAIGEDAKLGGGMTTFKTALPVTARLQV